MGSEMCIRDRHSGAEDEVTNLIPQTPFTKQDMRNRGMRSAAPTPDTAAIGRKFSFSLDAEQSGNDNTKPKRVTDSPLEEKADRKVDEKTTSEGPVPQSDFVKMFYEKRAELNRGWKQRRRDAMKQQRQRENRRLSKRPL